jgi:hypothetical protein
VQVVPAAEAGTAGFGMRRLRLGRFLLHDVYNANKRSLTVNRNDERGLALVEEMIKKADGFIENLALGAVERLRSRASATAAGQAAPRRSVTPALSGSSAPYSTVPAAARGGRVGDAAYATSDDCGLQQPN